MAGTCWTGLSARGVTPQSASARVREGWSLTRDEVPRLLGALRARAPRHEWFVLSTCSRTEIYAAHEGGPVPSADDAIRGALEEVRGAGPRDRPGEAAGRELSPSLPATATRSDQRPAPWTFTAQGVCAARHLFRVAAGLESVVLGDVQVLGQIRSAYDAARDSGTAGALISRLCETALYAGKRARAETGIARGAASMASAGIGLAAPHGASFKGRDAVVVGLGQMGQAIASMVASHRPRSLTLVTRGPDRIAPLAARLHAQAAPPDALAAVMAGADVVFCATGAPGAVLDASVVAAAMQPRADRPLVIVDLAVPADVDRAVAQVPGVTLHSIEGIERMMQSGRSQRSDAIEAVEAIVEQAVGRLIAWTPRLPSAA